MTNVFIYKQKTVSFSSSCNFFSEYVTSITFIEPATINSKVICMYLYASHYKFTVVSS